MNIQAQLQARRARLEERRQEEQGNAAAIEDSRPILPPEESNTEKKPKRGLVPKTRNQPSESTAPQKREVETWECKYCGHNCEMSRLKCVLCGGVKHGEFSTEEPASGPQRTILTEAQRRKFEQKWLADSDTDSDSSDDYEMQHGVRRPDEARFGVLIDEEYDNGGVARPQRRRIQSSDEEEPLVQPLNGNMMHLFNFYERKAPQDVSTRKALSTNFQIQLRKNQPRFKPALSAPEWQLLRNVDMDTDQPNTLIFTLGYSQVRISKALQGIIECEDAVQAIAAFAQTEVTFRILNRRGRQSRISFFDECTLTIGNERITPAKLQRQPFVDMLFTNFPILCDFHPWDDLMKVVLHCAQWNAQHDAIFPRNIQLPSQFDNLTMVTKQFESLARVCIRAAMKDSDLKFPLKRSDGVKILVDAITSLEDIHRKRVVPGLRSNKIAGRKAVALEGLNESRVKTESEITDVIMKIRSNPSWIAPTIEAAQIKRVERRKRATEESFVQAPKRKRKHRGRGNKKSKRPKN